MIDDDQLLEAFIGLGYATKTAVVYTVALRHAAGWCAAEGWTLDDVPASVLRGYSDSLPKSRSSRALARSALGAYWRLSGRSEPPTGAIRVPSQPRMRCRALDDPDAARLAAAATARGDLPGFAVLLGLYQALRRMEIASLCWSDFTGDGWLKILGKGDVYAELPVHPVIEGAARGLRRCHPPGPASEAPPGADWIFPGRFGRHVNPTTVWTWARQVAADAGLSPVPTHVLRHTALTAALDATHDLRAVQIFARHARPDTTAGYTRVRRDRLIEVTRSIHYRTPA